MKACRHRESCENGRCSYRILYLGTTGGKGCVERGLLVCDVDFICGSLKDSPIHQDSGLKQM